MSQADQKSIGTETTTASEDIENEKLVPMSESVRYRKRAQSAEREAKVLAEQLTAAETEVSQISRQLNDVKLEQELSGKLTAAGTIDLEAAMLIAKSRIKGSEKGDVDSCIEQLKQEKAYLFGNGAEPVSEVSKKTSGVKDRSGSGRTILENAARKAATSGSRADLHDYLRVRRNFI